MWCMAKKTYSKKEKELISKTKRKWDYTLTNRVNIDGVIYEKWDKVNLTDEQKKTYNGSYK